MTNSRLGRRPLTHPCAADAPLEALPTLAIRQVRDELYRIVGLAVLALTATCVCAQTRDDPTPVADITHATSLVEQLDDAVLTGTARQIEDAYADLHALDEPTLAALAQWSWQRTRGSARDKSPILGLLAVRTEPEHGAMAFGHYLPRCPVGDVSDRPEVNEAFRYLAEKTTADLLPVISTQDQAADSAIHWLENLGPAAAAALPALTNRLKVQQNPHAEIAAIGCMGPTAAEAVPLIVRFLKEPYFDAALAALVHIGAASAPALLDLIRAPLDEDDVKDGIAHARAIVALGELGRSLSHQADTFIPTLQTMLDHGPPFDCLAVAAIENFGRVADLLSGLRADLADADAEIRMRAVERISCLAEFGPVDADLHNALNDDHPAVAARAVAVLRGRQRIAAGSLSISRADVTQMCTDVESATPSDRAEAIRRYALLPDTGQWALSDRTINVMRQALDDPDVEVRRAASAGLLNATIQWSPAFDDSMSRALSDPDLQVRLDAIKLLRAKGEATHEATRLMLRALQDADPHVRDLAQVALSEQADATIIAPTMFDGDDDARRRAAMLLPYGDEPDEAGRDLIGRALCGDNEDVRAAAVHAAARWDDQRLLTLLRAKNATCRRAALLAFGERDSVPDAARPALLHALSNPDALMRRAAVPAIARLGTEAIPRLLAALGDSDAGVQNAAEAGFYAIGLRAVPALRTAAAGTDLPVARHAGAALLWEWNWTPEALDNVTTSATTGQNTMSPAEISADPHGIFEHVGNILGELPKGSREVDPRSEIPPEVSALLVQLKHQVRNAALSLLNHTRGAADIGRVETVLRRDLLIVRRRDHHAHRVYAQSVDVTLAMPDGHPDLAVLTVGIDTPCGGDTSLYLLRHQNHAWRLAFTDEIDGYTSQTDGLTAVQYYVAAPAADGSFFLIVASERPICESRYNGVTASVYRFAGRDDQATLVAQQEEAVDWGGAQLSADSTGYALRVPFSSGIDIDRSRTRALRYIVDGEKVYRARPLAENAFDLIDEWLELPWPIAAINSNPSNPALKRWHFAAAVMRAMFQGVGSSSQVRWGELEQVQIESLRNWKEAWGSVYFQVGERSGVRYVDSVGILPRVLTE